MDRTPVQILQTRPSELTRMFESLQMQQRERQQPSVFFPAGSFARGPHGVILQNPFDFLFSQQSSSTSLGSAEADGHTLHVLHGHLDPRRRALEQHESASQYHSSSRQSSFTTSSHEAQSRLPLQDTPESFVNGIDPELRATLVPSPIVSLRIPLLEDANIHAPSPMPPPSPHIRPTQLDGDSLTRQPSHLSLNSSVSANMQPFIMLPTSNTAFDFLRPMRPHNLNPNAPQFSPAHHSDPRMMDHRHESFATAWQPVPPLSPVPAMEHPRGFHDVRDHPSRDLQQQHIQRQQRNAAMMLNHQQQNQMSAHFKTKAVCELVCKACDNEVCSRGMKAILLANSRVELFSTDAPPPGVQLVAEDYTTSSCRCKIRDVCCLGCGNVVGYHVTHPCDRCLDACNNGHFWMFHSECVGAKERRSSLGNVLLWENLPLSEKDKKLCTEDLYDDICR